MRDAVPPGSYLFGVRTFDGRCAYTRLAVPDAEEEIDLGDLVVQRGGTVHLEVLDEEGRHLTNAWIWVLDAEGRGVAARWVADPMPGTRPSLVATPINGRTLLYRLVGRLEGLAAGRDTLRIRRIIGHRDVEFEVPEAGEVEKKARLGEESGR